MSFDLQKISNSIAVLLVAFLLGVLSSAIVSRHRKSRESVARSPIQDRSDEWHRLFEAAGMTGDGDIIAEVRNRLLCTNREGETIGVKIDIDLNSWCRLDDGTLKDLSQYIGNGSFSDQILKSHSDWSLHNLDFLKSVDSGVKARQYVREHRWPQ